MSTRSLFINTYKLVDLITLILCFGITYIVDSGGKANLSTLLSLQFKISHLVLSFFFIMLWHFNFLAIGLYQSKRIGSRYGELTDILKCTSIGSLIMLVTGYLLGFEMLRASFISIFWVVSSLLIVSGRLVIRSVLSVLRKKGVNSRNIVIVGSGERSVDFARSIQNKKELGYNLVGFIDDQWISKRSVPDAPLLGNINQVNHILNNHVIDEVMISLPVKSFYEKIEEIIRLCEEQGIVVRCLTNIFTVSIAKSKLSYVDDIPVLTLATVPYEDTRMLIKRSIDLSVSIVLLVLLLPVFVVVGLLVKLTSPGPVFFMQKRIGHNKRIFKVIKYRTMIKEAEEFLPELENMNESGGATFKIKNDPRITKTGKVLRKTSLDEMPQLINVLKGDMSLVGPRPLPLRDYKEFDADWQKRRFSMKPGLTCFWQIGGRNNLSFTRWMELDMEYIDKWSLWLDLKILWKTIPAVLFGKGAM